MRQPKSSAGNAASARRSRQPFRTVTVLFTDIEGSTRLWEADPRAMRRNLAWHDKVLYSNITGNGGHVFKALGDGVASVFSDPTAAVLSAVSMQRALAARKWHTGEPIRVRIALYSGAVESAGHDYSGPALNRASRLLASAHGGQILVGAPTVALLSGAELGESSFKNLGEHSLRGVERAEAVFQVVAPGLEADFPPLREGGLVPAIVLRHNLSDDDRPFVGRVSERAALAGLLGDRRTRLVSITGMGGVGKTRLARQAIRELCDSFADGAWLVECDAMAGKEDLVTGIGASLSLESSGPDPEWELIRALRSKRALVVLDCFEGQVKHASFLDRLLREAPGLKLLVTSRIVLGLAREFDMPLEPFAVEGGAGATNDCVELFASAAAHAKPGFKVSPRNRFLVVDLCKDLEGVPLALILAAARLRYLTLTELREEVRRNRLQVLRRTDGLRDRHADLQSVIAHSFDLLESSDRRLLARLGVFVGGFTLDDARKVCLGEDVLDGLARLRDNSLLQVQTADGRSRYKILDSIREYLAGLRNSGRFERVHAEDAARHAEHFATRALEVDRLMSREKWQEGSATLWRDLGNFRSAIQTATSGAMHGAVANLAEGLARHLFEAGLWNEFEALSKSAKPASEALNRPKVLVGILGLQGALARRRGRESAAEKLWLKRIEVSEAAGDRVAVADAWFDLGLQAHERGDFDAALQRLDASFEIVRKLKDEPHLAAIHAIRAEVYARTGRPKEACEEARMTLEHLREGGERKPSLIVYRALCHAYLELGQFDFAEASARQIIRLGIEGGRTIAAGWGLLDLAECASRRGDAEMAARALAAALRTPADKRSRFRKTVCRTAVEFRGGSNAQDLKAAEQQASMLTWREQAAKIADLGPDLFAQENA